MEFNVRGFGAVGDGATNDRGAILAAQGAAAPVLAGIIVTVRASIVADPHAAIFDISAGDNAEIRVQHTGAVYANWWTGGDIAESWNLMKRGLRHFGNDSRDKVP